MPQFIVNKNAQATGEHEVHDLSQNCKHLPNSANQVNLGIHVSCRSAIVEAKKYYTNVDGCAYCASACNTR